MTLAAARFRDARVAGGAPAGETGSGAAAALLSTAMANAAILSRSVSSAGARLRGPAAERHVARGWSDGIGAVQGALSRCSRFGSFVAAAHSAEFDPNLPGEKAIHRSNSSASILRSSPRSNCCSNCCSGVRGSVCANFSSGGHKEGGGSFCPPATLAPTAVPLEHALTSRQAVDEFLGYIARRGGDACRGALLMLSQPAALPGAQSGRRAPTAEELAPAVSPYGPDCAAAEAVRRAVTQVELLFAPRTLDFAAWVGWAVKANALRTKAPPAVAKAEIDTILKRSPLEGRHNRRVTLALRLLTQPWIFPSEATPWIEGLLGALLTDEAAADVHDALWKRLGAEVAQRTGGGDGVDAAITSIQRLLTFVPEAKHEELIAKCFLSWPDRLRAAFTQMVLQDSIGWPLQMPADGEP